MTDTEKKIAEIKEALQKATPGPWKIDEFGAVTDRKGNLIQWYDGKVVTAQKEDAHLIANAPEWLRFLLEERNKLIEGLRSIRKELDRRFRESDRKWEREADMYEQGKSAAYDEADSLICDILREIGVNVDGHPHQVV